MAPSGCMEGWNNAIHKDYFDDFIYYNYWIACWILGPIFGLCIFVYDLFTGFLFPLWYIKPSLDKVIFITGCDTGFGRSLALRLSKRGFKVYAACLSDKGMEELKQEAPAIHTVKLDVTKSEQIQAAADLVDAENPDGLYCLVNNAGVAKSALIDWSTMKDYRFVMEVNFFGLLTVTKAFLPQIKRCRGRIVNMSSIAGISCGYPLSSAYATSKHAVEVFTSTLRQELRPWGIKVCTLNPGFHKTEMNQVAVQGLRNCWAQVPQDIKDQYGETYFQGCEEVVRLHTEENVYDPKNVINAMEHAVCATRPRVQYRVGIDAKYGLVWTQIFPLRIGEKITYAATTNSKMQKVNGLKPAVAAP